MICECCGKPLNVRIVYGDGSIGWADEQTMHRYRALYGEPTTMRFEPPVGGAES